MGFAMVRPLYQASCTVGLIHVAHVQGGQGPRGVARQDPQAACRGCRWRRAFLVIPAPTNLAGKTDSFAAPASWGVALWDPLALLLFSLPVEQALFELVVTLLADVFP